LALYTVVGVTLWPAIFPWHVGHSLIHLPALNAPAYYVGVSGWSFLLNAGIMIIALLLATLSCRPLHPFNRGSRVHLTLTLSIIIALFTASFYGREHRMRSTPGTGIVKVMVIQGQYLDVEDRVVQLEQLLDSNPSVRFVIVPEWDMSDIRSSVLSHSKPSGQGLLTRLRRIASSHRVGLIYTEYQRDTSGVSIRATLHDEHGSIARREKSSLIPFFEYLPDWAKPFNYGGVAGSSANRIHTGLDMPMRLHTWPLMLRVCYDSIERGWRPAEILIPSSPPGLVIVLANMDAFTPHVVRLHQYLDAAWAVENGVQLLRAVLPGGSTLISSQGGFDEAAFDVSWNTGVLFFDVLPTEPGSGRQMGAIGMGIFVLLSLGLIGWRFFRPGRNPHLMRAQ
jgi:apolipoprotein N-acyltransferase